ncbi:integrase [Staphylococcus hominis]|uniref:tyrosine-type recombinase/integrase n=1 Tax=Staphylococcus hominis TaxID=1290 RepID=UPI0016113998|nr:site-specific integrase [Staphylococcus hominis]MBB4833057.1 integrase [Staphylococcus hominis]
MWHEKFTNKHGETKYRYYEKYKDPLTNKWRRVSVVLNKNGKQSQKEAQKRLNERIEEKLNNKTPTTLKTLTFHAACDEWFESYKRSSGVKMTTVNLRKRVIYTFKSSVDEDVLIRNVNHVYLQDLINKWADKYSYSYVQSLMSIVRFIFKYILKWYDLDLSSVLERVEIPKKARTREEVQAKKNNYLEPSEVKELLICLDDLAERSKTVNGKHNVNMVKNIVEFQCNNGMRIGELLAIKNENIDIDNKKLEINGTLNYIHDPVTNTFGLKETTKTTTSDRTIGLTSQSIKLLKSIMLQNKKNSQWNNHYRDRGFVFTNAVGSPMVVATINDTIKEAVKMSSIDKRVTTHTLRHTHISTLAQLGINIKAIQDRVGHSDYKTTLEIYTHVTDKMAQDMMNKLENFKIG